MNGANTDSAVPRPRRRLWRTFFKRPRELAPFAPPISFQEVAAPLPSLEEATHWGEIILLEDHKSVLHRDGTITYGVHHITLLYGDQNLAAWDEVSWAYQRKQWRPKVHRALLYMPEGSIQPAAIQDQVIDAANQVSLMRVTFGPLRRGVIVEFEHQEDHFFPMPLAPCNWGQFFLQTGPPCRRRRFTVAVAEPFTAAIQLHHGAPAPMESKVQQYQVFQWDQRQVPGIEWDAWTPPLRDFAPWVDFSTLPTWDPVVTHFRKEMSPTLSPEVRELARSLTSKVRGEREKLSALYSYTAQQLRYGRPPQELYLTSSRPVSKMFEDLRGDCKDKSALLVSLLGAVGIPAHIAVVLTRAKGLAPFLPSQRFDHALVVTRVEDQEYWLDAAAGSFSFGDIPYQDQGIRALVLDDDRRLYTEVPQPRPEDHGAEFLCQGQLKENGDYEYQGRFAARGERAAILRQAIFDRNPDFRDRFFRQIFAQGLPGAEVSDLRPGPVDDLTGPLEYQYRVKLAGWARPIEKLLLFRVPWAEPALFEGSLAADQRPQPLAAPLVQSVLDRHEIDLPPHFTGYGLPYQVHEECPWARYDNSARIEGNRLVCERRLSFLGGLVLPDRFRDFKRFWSACARADTGDIVLIMLG